MLQRISIFLLMISVAGGALVSADEPIRIAVFTGGHGFDEEAFHEAFKSMENVQFFEAVYPQAEDLYAPEYRKWIDVFVFYDMNAKMKDETKQFMLDMLKEGKGIVALHHCIASYPQWPEYIKIIGAKYFLEPETFMGKKWEKSTYKHDIWMDIKVENKNHPVTKGLEDFRIYDEAYGNHWVSPDTKLLLSCKHPESQGSIAWTNEYGKARIVYIQLGHGPEAYENPSFRKLVNNAIVWVDEGRKAAQK